MHAFCIPQADNAEEPKSFFIVNYLPVPCCFFIPETGAVKSVWRLLSRITTWEVLRCSVISSATLGPPRLLIKYCFGPPATPGLNDSLLDFWGASQFSPVYLTRPCPGSCCRPPLSSTCSLRGRSNGSPEGALGWCLCTYKYMIGTQG